MARLRRHNLKKNNDVDLERLIYIFNTEGKKAAMEFSEKEYKTSYATVQRRIKEETAYSFSRNSRKYELIEEKQASFMTLEELYEDKPKSTSKTNKDRSSFDPTPHLDENIFKEVVVNLMKDKMQEISKYVHLEQSTKLALISLKRLEESGYKVILD